MQDLYNFYEQGEGIRHRRWKWAGSLALSTGWDANLSSEDLRDQVTTERTQTFTSSSVKLGAYCVTFIQNVLTLFLAD